MTLSAISLRDDRYRRLAGFTLGALVGATCVAVYQYGDRIAITRTNEMLQAAQGGGALPESLASTAFAAHGQGLYEL